MREKKRQAGIASNRGARRQKEKPTSMQEWLEREIWPHMPEEELGKPPLTKG
jgi:hypothetical protein